MIILGIDPGFGRMGFGVIEKYAVSARVLEVGTIETDANTTPAERLAVIYTKLSSLAKRWKPVALSIERLFFTTNHKTAIPVAEARGVALLTAALHGLKVYEYTPSQVKLAITGSGTADKKAVKKMVLLMVGKSSIPGHDDAVDAIALALTAAYDRRNLI